MKSITSLALRSAVCILAVLIFLGSHQTGMLRTFSPRQTVFRMELVVSAPQEALESPFAFPTNGNRGNGAGTQAKALFGANKSIRIPDGEPDTEPEPNLIPENYTELTFTNCDFPVYAFINTDGRFEYRTLLERNENGIRRNGFIRVSPVLSGTAILFDRDENAPFVFLKDEAFGTLIPMNPPITETMGLTRYWGVDGLYFRIREDGSRQYYFYGTYPGNSPGFVPADAEGRMIPGILPVIFDMEKENQTT